MPLDVEQVRRKSFSMSGELSVSNPILPKIGMLREIFGRIQLEKQQKHWKLRMNQSTEGARGEDKRRT